MPLPPCSRVMTRTEDAVIVWSRHKLRFQPRRISYAGFLQSSAVRFVELCSETNPQQSRSLKKGSAAAVGVRHADRQHGDRSLRSIKRLRHGEPPMRTDLKINARIICGRKVQQTENWLRCHLWGGFASFHWACFGEYLRADSEHQVENVVWKASSNGNAGQGDR